MRRENKLMMMMMDSSLDPLEQHFVSQFIVYSTVSLSPSITATRKRTEPPSKPTHLEHTPTFFIHFLFINSFPPINDGWLAGWWMDGCDGCSTFSRSISSPFSVPFASFLSPSTWNDEKRKGRGCFDPHD